VKYSLRADVFRFAPESGLRSDIAPCPKGARRRHGRFLVAHRKQAMKSQLYLVAASLLANASLSESIEHVVLLTTKLRIARMCVALLMEPLDREVRSDCIQFR
jgi:hypothetical protein